MERVFNQVFELEISRDLLAYEVEFHVLQEEMLASPMPSQFKLRPTVNQDVPAPLHNGDAPPPSQVPSTTGFAKLQDDNRNLKRQVIIVYKYIYIYIFRTWSY